MVRIILSLSHTHIYIDRYIHTYSFVYLRLTYSTHNRYAVTGANVNCAKILISRSRTDIHVKRHQKMFELHELLGAAMLESRIKPLQKLGIRNYKDLENAALDAKKWKTLGLPKKMQVFLVCSCRAWGGGMTPYDYTLYRELFEPAEFKRIVSMHDDYSEVVADSRSIAEKHKANIEVRQLLKRRFMSDGGKYKSGIVEVCAMHDECEFLSSYLHDHETEVSDLPRLELIAKERGHSRVMQIIQHEARRKQMIEDLLDDTDVDTSKFKKKKKKKKKKKNKVDNVVIEEVKEENEEKKKVVVAKKEENPVVEKEKQREEEEEKEEKEEQEEQVDKNVAESWDQDLEDENEEDENEKKKEKVEEEQHTSWRDAIYDQVLRLDTGFGSLITEKEVRFKTTRSISEELGTKSTGHGVVDALRVRIDIASEKDDIEAINSIVEEVKTEIENNKTKRSDDDKYTESLIKSLRVLLKMCKKRIKRSNTCNEMRNELKDILKRKVFDEMYEHLKKLNQSGGYYQRQLKKDIVRMRKMLANILFQRLDLNVKSKNFTMWKKTMTFVMSCELDLRKVMSWKFTELRLAGGQILRQDLRRAIKTKDPDQIKAVLNEIKASDSYIKKNLSYESEIVNARRTAQRLIKAKKTQERMEIQKKALEELEEQVRQEEMLREKERRRQQQQEQQQ